MFTVVSTLRGFVFVRFDCCLAYEFGFCVISWLLYTLVLAIFGGLVIDFGDIVWFGLCCRVCLFGLGCQLAFALLALIWLF